MKTNRFTMDLLEASIKDIELVGGKNASLGEMMQHLRPLGIRIPDGFIVSSRAYFQYIKDNDLDQRIRDIIENSVIEDLKELSDCGSKVRQLVQEGNFSEAMEAEIISAYRKLIEQHGNEPIGVAVRSSATAEDLPDASFAGQQDTYLNIRGEQHILRAIKSCFASLFTDRAISYRETFGFGHFHVGLSVCVQKMVRSDKGVSGVAFSIDTESGFKDAVVINGAYGLGEMIVQGAINPDEFIVFKPLLKMGFSAIIEKKLGLKQEKMIYAAEGAKTVAVVKTSVDESSRFCLNDQQILELSKWVVIIEDYYSELKGKWCPMDVEWAVDGLTQELFVVQARPETIHSRKDQDSWIAYSIDDPSRMEHLVLQGTAVGDKIGAGKVRILSADPDDPSQLTFKQGDVLVADMTDPDWEPIMKKASAIVTNKGGRTCHAAIVAREMGIPAVVGCGNATAVLKTGEEVTVSCAEGDTGLIYRGMLAFTRTALSLASLPKCETPILLNVASPDLAFSFSNLPCQGIGLAREEFIINNYIKAHPLALLHHHQLGDESLTTQINRLICGFKNGEEFFIDKLSFGIAKIASAFYPNKVIVRFSDFKSNEYFNLLGGKYFEPKEENPMIGWRGASRYYSDTYKEAFALEVKAIKRVREQLGLKNVVVMIPFCRTVEELLKVYSVMEEFGLKRGQDGLEVYLMAELPSNILLADEFAKHIDGFSIGSNDLTQLVLGLDRDSALVAHLYDERNMAVKKMIKTVIAAAKNAGIKVGICGQGPSDHPDFAQFLVEEGIDTLSVTPDSFFKTVTALCAIEEKMLMV